MKNPASIPLPATQTQPPPNLTIQIPSDQDIKEYRRQQALERLRSQNQALPSASAMALPQAPSVPRSAVNPAGWESLKKN